MSASFECMIDTFRSHLIKKTVFLGKVSAVGVSDVP